MTTDGPHIFYRPSSITLRSIVARNGVPTVQTQHFNLQQRQDIIVTCTFPEHPEWNFSTPLQATLSTAPDSSPAAGSILAIADIEGDFAALRQLLIGNGVIDAQYNWTFGNGRLVLAGDCFDRGPYVTECLWLLYSLEEKARQQGGRLHFVLGNHEIMNMSDDFRYVPEKYFDHAAAYGTEYSLWFKPGTELGRWLATRHIVEKIGPLLFVHGGIAPAVNALEWGLPDINNLCRPWYFTPGPALPPIPALRLLLYSEDAPFWYRGYALGTATLRQVKATLSKFDVSHIVIGHTMVNQVRTFFGGRVIDVDTPHAAGISEGLLVEQGRLYRVNSLGRRYTLR